MKALTKFLLITFATATATLPMNAAKVTLLTQAKGRICTIVFTMLFLLGAMASVEAADTKFFRFTNNTGGPVSDLHVTFINTGGNLTTTVLRNAPGCPPPTIPSNGQSTNTMVIDWSRDCVANGASVNVRVTTINGPLVVASGVWTNRANPQPPGVAPLDPERDIEEIDEEEAGGQEDPGNNDDQGHNDDDNDNILKWILIFIILILLILLYWLWKKLKEHKPQGGGGNGDDDKPLDPIHEQIIELESKRDLLKRLRQGKTPQQKKDIDEAIKKINEAIDGLKKLKAGSDDPNLEGNIQKALRDAADAVDRANPGNRSLPLKRLAECLRDIERNLF